MTTIAIVYFSGYGHTAKQAQAVHEGAATVTDAKLFRIDSNGDLPEGAWEEIGAAKAIIYGSPTYMGGPSAQFKAFQDATSKTVFAAGGTWRNKLAAGFTNSASRSGDKLASLQQIAIFAAQHGMHWVALGLPPGNNSSTGSEEDLNRLGFFLGAAAQSNADQGAEVAPSQSDLRTAEHLGARVAETALQFVRGSR